MTFQMTVWLLRLVLIVFFFGLKYPLDSLNHIVLEEV